MLAALAETAKTALEVMDIMLLPRNEAWRYVHGRPLRGRSVASASELEADERQKFYNLLNYLKRQGFIESKKHGRASFWKTTGAGLKKLGVLRERNLYSAANTQYGDPKTDAGFKIIAYDIPAKEGGKKRFWLRAALARMGFTTLQKSVWVGKKKIPEQFLEDLRARRMLPYVHVFEVGKSGTIKEVA